MALPLIQLREYLLLPKIYKYKSMPLLLAFLGRYQRGAEPHRVLYIFTARRYTATGCTAVLLGTDQSEALINLTSNIRFYRAPIQQVNTAHWVTLALVTVTRF